MCVFLFQLHHTGIKTGVSLAGFPPCLNFNCTIQELKPLDLTHCRLVKFISIAPYRN
ncbi:hypothetical protein HMPREF1553_00479 [Porphyromonas gingivalis F0568]|nr:hypothetical protein HMPREF1553_00479 [Porphyromonas gingivalis F0568]